MMSSSQLILKVAIAVLSLLVPPLQHTVALLPNSITYARSKFAKFRQCRDCNNDRDSSTMLEASRLSPMVDNMAVSKTIEIHALTMVGACIYIYIYACILTCSYILTHAYSYMHTHIYIHIYIHAPTLRCTCTCT